MVEILTYSTIYSATTFPEKWFENSGSRYLVREIWFEKSDWPEKKNSSFQNHFSRTKVIVEKSRSEGSLMEQDTIENIS